MKSKATTPRPVGQLMRARSLSIAFAMAIVPLVILLGLQFKWLSQLQDSAVVVRQAAQRSHLETLTGQAEHFYRATAERLLTVPATFFTGDDLDRVAEYWHKKNTAGVHLLFAVDFTKIATGNYYIFDPGAAELTATPASDESVAIVLATLPWQTHDAPKVDREGLHTNEQDPNRRMILNPLIDDSGEVIAIVGMLIERGYFVEQLLEPALKGLWRKGVGIVVSDEQDRPVLGQAGDAEESVRMRFGFVFSNWTAIAYAPGSEDGGPLLSPFAWNMLVGLLLAVVLLSGIGFALGAAGKAIRLSRMKSDFVSNVSHELRTPLASIRVFAELLSHGRVSSPDKIKEYGGYIDSESRRLSHLIDNILDFSRIESQRKEYDCVPSNIVDLLRQVVATFALRLSSSGHRLELELPAAPSQVPDLHIDPSAISLALHNLLDNAIKYSDGGVLGVSLVHEPDEVRILVRDDGIGIEKHEQVRVFERFHRAGSSLVHDVKGSGLGLAIVAHVMEAHEGRVSVQSELGRGCTFVLHFPLRGGAPSAPA